MGTITVHNPSGFEPPIIDKTFAKRLDNMDEKTIYFVIVPFANTPTFMEQLREQFAEQFPKTDVRIVSAGGRDKMTLDPALSEEIAQNAHAAVVGIGL